MLPSSGAAQLRASGPRRLCPAASRITAWPQHVQAETAEVGGHGRGEDARGARPGLERTAQGVVGAPPRAISASSAGITVSRRNAGDALAQVVEPLAGRCVHCHGLP